MSNIPDEFELDMMALPHVKSITKSVCDISTVFVIEYNDSDVLEYAGYTYSETFYLEK